MKQLIQYFKTGQLELIESPVPSVDANSLVVRTKASLISVGTEKMLLEFGKASFLNKARQQPERVKQVLDKIKTEGLLSTLEAVWSKLNEPIPLGYSNVGTVVEAGRAAGGFREGDRVLSNGPHGEFVKVPWTLAASVPEKVTDEEAAFGVLGAIAIEGVRLLNPQLGETVVVIGLGLLGQLTMQILRANGCRVIGTDIDESKVRLAQASGAQAFVSGSVEENVHQILGFTDGVGADGVIITASAASPEILSESALMCRKRGRIVLIGVVPITVPRNLFYEKELSFQVSSSYGPGRYDPLYEEKGNDYPLPYVRWTAKRNMESFLFLLEQNKVRVTDLITHRFLFPDILKAYQSIEAEKPLGILIEYPEAKQEESKQIKLSFPGTAEADKMAVERPVVGFIGAGNFAKMVLLPALKESDARLRLISASNGFGGSIAGKRFGFEEATSDRKMIFEDPEINTVFIATRHSSHAALVAEGLKSGKHVFVEKPLALSFEELKNLLPVVEKSPELNLLVGFNRRFSPFSRKLRETLRDRQDPISVMITVNAGEIPPEHWVHDPEVGGGRIIGEGCHFVDLARYLVGHSIQAVSAVSTRGHSVSDEDKTMMLLEFADGSQAAIHYLANGSKKFPKERVEVFSSGRVFVIDNFKRLTGYGASLSHKALKQDKGHKTEISEFLQSVEKGEPSPIPPEEIFEVHLATLAVYQAIAEKNRIDLTAFWADIKSD